MRCIERLPKKGGAYDRDLAHVIMRTLCRLDLQAHWLHLRYRPISPLFWGRVFVAIKLAEERELLHLPITLNSAAKTETTIAQEMLKLFMMSVATPEHLTKKQIDLAHLLIQRLAGTFCWEQIPYGSTFFYVDFSKPQTPVRLDKVSEQHFMAHCFGSSEAVSALVVGLKQLAQGGMPTTLGAVDFSNYKREDLLDVMAHLSQCWRKMDAQNVPPYFDKHHASRTQIFDQISVVHSFAVLYAQLAQSAMLQSPPSASLTLSADENETESWVVENISQMGYGVTLAKQKEDWVQHHTLIGIQSDTTPWQIGVIRRVASESVENTHVGIQILSNRSSAVMLRAADTEMSIGEPAVDTQTPHHPLGILMHKALPYQDEESLLLASGSYQLQRIYTMVVGEAQRTIRLLDRINTFQNGDQLIFIDV